MAQARPRAATSARRDTLPLRILKALYARAPRNLQLAYRRARASRRPVLTAVEPNRGLPRLSRVGTNLHGAAAADRAVLHRSAWDASATTLMLSGRLPAPGASRLVARSSSGAETQWPLTVVGDTFKIGLEVSDLMSISGPVDTETTWRVELADTHSSPTYLIDSAWTRGGATLTPSRVVGGASLHTALEKGRTLQVIARPRVVLADDTLLRGRNLEILLSSSSPLDEVTAVNQDDSTEIGLNLTDVGDRLLASCLLPALGSDYWSTWQFRARSGDTWHAIHPREDKPDRRPSEAGMLVDTARTGELVVVARDRTALVESVALTEQHLTLAGHLYGLDSLHPYLTVSQRRLRGWALSGATAFEIVLPLEAFVASVLRSGRTTGKVEARGGWEASPRPAHIIIDNESGQHLPLSVEVDGVQVRLERAKISHLELIGEINPSGSNAVI